MQIKRGNRKGQMTLFIIIAIVLLMGVGFFIYASMEGTTDEDGRSLEGESEETGKGSTEKNKIRSFIQSCFEEVTDDALILFGKQGGYIYRSQGGIDDDFTSDKEGVYFLKYDICTDGKSCMVPYWIKNSHMGACNTDFKICPSVPNYPWKKFPYKDGTSMEVDPTGQIFGRTLAPPLYEHEARSSIIGKLRSYIQNNLEICLGGFKEFEEEYEIKELGLGEELKLNTSVLLTKNDFRVYLDYPIEFVKDTKTITFDRFNYKVHVRLRRLYDAIVDLSKVETSDPRFNIVYDGTEYINQEDADEIGRNYLGLNGKDGKVALIRGTDRYEDGRAPVDSNDDILVHFYDDVIEVEDLKSKLKKERYLWRFARQNRAPALYYIHDEDDGNGIDVSRTSKPILVADDTTSKDFEKIVLNTGLEYFAEVLPRKDGHIIEVDKKMVDQIERTIIYVPSDKRDFSDLTLYNTLRNGWKNQLETASNTFLYKHEVKAVDPDEDDVVISVNSRKRQYNNFDQMGYVISRGDCCNNRVVLRATVSDEAGLQDYQDMMFSMNQNTQSDGSKCHYGVNEQCAGGGPITVNLNPMVINLAPKLKMNLVFVAINYGSDVLTNNQYDFHGLSNQLYLEIQDDYGADYDFTMKKLNRGWSLCADASTLKGFVDGAVGSFVDPTVPDGPDDYVIIAIDAKNVAEYVQVNNNCYCEFDSDNKVVRINKNGNNFCTTQYDSIVGYYDYIRSNILPDLP